MSRPHRHRGAGFVRLTLVLVVLAGAIWAGYIIRDKRLSVSDLETWFTEPPPIGRQAGDSLARLGIDPADVREGEASGLRFAGLTKYLNDAQAVVTHTADDSSPRVPDTIAVLDRYDIKATFFISTARRAEELWPVLSRAVKNGHEVGSHARTHPCQFPPDQWFCTLAYSNDELIGSRDDILAHVDQPYVWSFAYPCGLCNEHEFVRDKLRHAGYLVARIYPDEVNGGHLVPDMNTWDDRRYRATYTQAVQKDGGIAPSGRTDVAAINAKSDEVIAAGGIYNFLTHPNWLDFEAGSFYEQHLAHIARRPNLWYVPMGPLYAYQTTTEHTKVQALADGRFAVTHDLSPQVFPNSVTIEFATGGREVSGVRSERGEIPLKGVEPTYGWDGEFYRVDGDRLLVTVQPNSVLEIL